MTTLAFMCTGSNQGWDPFCNGGDLLFLVLLGLIGGGAVTGLMRHRVTGGFGRFLLWLLATFLCLALSLSIGFAAA